MEINLTTPGLLFPAISLLLLAFTNRFLGLATLIRDLHAKYRSEPDETTARQIDSLRHRVNLIKWMQVFGAGSLLLCVVCMFVLFEGWDQAGEVVFEVSLALMAISLIFSLWEIFISVDALNLRLSDMDQRKGR